jgi:hypothetical protein
MNRGKRGKLPRWLRRVLIASAIVVGMLVMIRLVLDPVATHVTRKALNDADAIRGDFQGVHVGVPPGTDHPPQDRRAPAGDETSAVLRRAVAARLDLRELLPAGWQPAPGSRAKLAFINGRYAAAPTCGKR